MEDRVNIPKTVFRYTGMAHTEAESEFVSISLWRGTGQFIEVVLPVGDAQHLCDDLPEQIRIARSIKR